MKVLGILGFVLYVMHCGLCAKSNGVLLRFVSVSCSSSNKTCVDWLCFVRPFSRTVTTLNIRTTFLRPMYQVYADVALDYKYGTIYREVIRLFKIEVCSIVNGTSENYVVNIIHDTLRESIPELIHPCPYSGRVIADNITMNSNKIPSIFPSGTYRSRVHYYDKQDDNLMTIVSRVTCSSSIKTSF